MDTSIVLTYLLTYLQRNKRTIRLTLLNNCSDGPETVCFHRATVQVHATIHHLDHSSDSRLNQLKGQQTALWLQGSTHLRLNDAPAVDIGLGDVRTKRLRADGWSEDLDDQRRCSETALTMNSPTCSNHLQWQQDCAQRAQTSANTKISTKSDRGLESELPD